MKVYGIFGFHIEFYVPICVLRSFGSIRFLHSASPWSE